MKAHINGIWVQLRAEKRPSRADDFDSGTTWSKKVASENQ